MRIRKARSNDKESILAFCQNTFSWGDYIANVWDTWFRSEGLIIIGENEPLGMCHIQISKNQVWIEGLRVNPNFRRRGLARSLVNYVEKIAKRRHCKVSRMLIAQENKTSLKMANSLGYVVEGIWWLYYAKPKKTKSKATTASNPDCAQNLNSKIFTESWRWREIDRKTIARLVKTGRVIAFKNAMGIWNRSNMDDCIVQLGYLHGTQLGIREILKFIQNKGYLLKAKKIQILAPDEVDILAKDISRIMPFCLLRKDLF